MCQSVRLRSNHGSASQLCLNDLHATLERSPIEGVLLLLLALLLVLRLGVLLLLLLSLLWLLLGERCWVYYAYPPLVDDVGQLNPLLLGDRSRKIRSSRPSSLRSRVG